MNIFRMKTVKILVVAFYIIGVSCLHSFAADPWVGTWRCIVQKKSVDPFHLIFSKENDKYRVAFIGSNWSAMEFATVHIEGNRAELRTPNRAKSGIYKIILEAGRLTGTVDLIHPQYKSRNEFWGEKVLETTQLSPQLKREDFSENEDYFDLHVQIYQYAPLDSTVEEFVRYWDKEIEPKYYVFLMDLTYPKSGGIKDRNENLKRIFESLKSEEYRKQVEQFRSTWNRAIQQIKEKAPKLLFKNPFLGVPSTDPNANKPLVIDRSLFFRINPQQIVLCNYKNLQAWIIKEVLKMPSYRIFPPHQNANTNRVIRDGFGAELALSHGLAESYADFLPVNSKTDIPLGQLKELYRSKYAESSDTVDENISVILGGAFAKQFLAAYPLDEVLQWNNLRVLNLFSAFLAGS